MLKVGLSVNEQLFHKEHLAAMKQAGIDAVEISHGDYRNYTEYDFRKAKQMAFDHGIQLWSMHLPFMPFSNLDPASLDRDVRKATFKLLRELIKKGTDIGIDKFVVHPSAEPNQAEERSEKLKAAADFFNELAEAASAYGATVALEDLPRTCLGNSSEELLYLLRANEKLRACYDTNHLLGESNTDFIKQVGARIITLHVSDYDFLNERHWLPGEGDNDWQGIYQALMDAGYQGVWMYELGLLPPKTIQRRELTYTDFYRNAQEIMTGCCPTPIGTRVEGLSFWK